jgi:cytochrome c biogenesis protein CcmG/thiol:disulfide interchange protein DsbE
MLSVRTRTPLRLLIAAMTVVAANGSMAEPATILDLDQYKGKVVVLDFWASWCVPCRRSFPWLNAMHAKYSGQGLVIIGVNVDNDPAAAAAFLEDYSADFHIYYDTGAVVARQYDIQGMPSTVVVGRDGEIEETHIGFKVKRQNEYEAVLVAALNEGTER